MPQDWLNTMSAWKKPKKKASFQMFLLKRKTKKLRNPNQARQQRKRLDQPKRRQAQSKRKVRRLRKVLHHPNKRKLQLQKKRVKRNQQSLRTMRSGSLPMTRIDIAMQIILIRDAGIYCVYCNHYQNIHFWHFYWTSIK